jgi:hypothetical protein
MEGDSSMAKKRPEPSKDAREPYVDDDETRTVKPQKSPAGAAAIAKVATKVVEKRVESRAVEEEAVPKAARSRHPGREDTYTAPPKNPSANAAPNSDEARMAKMRELYAKGQADAALSVASSMTKGSSLKQKTAPMAWRPGALEKTLPAPVDRTVEARTVERKNVPRLAMSRTQIAKTPLDPRAKLIINRVDGTTSIRVILEASGLSDDDGRRLVEQLVALGVVSFA